MHSAPNVYSRPWFRCLASMGFCLRKHIDRIYAETVDHEGRDWLDLVAQFEMRYQLSTKSPLQPDDVDYMAKFAQKEFSQFASSFGAEAAASGTDLGEVLLEVAREMRPLSDEEISQGFDELNRKAFTMAQDCATNWGGPQAALRASHIKPRPLNLDVSSSAWKPSPVAAWTDADAIHVPTGNGPRPLLDFLCLEFCLLHEYLSHVLPPWEDGAGLVSEGYLFPVARWWQTYVSAFAVTSSLVQIDWQEHRQRVGIAQAPNYWEEFGRRVDWLEFRCPRARLCWILLEFASVEDEPRGRFQEAFLGFIEALVKAPQNSEEILKILNSNSTDIVLLHRLIQKQVRRTMPHKLLNRLGFNSSGD